MQARWMQWMLAAAVAAAGAAGCAAVRQQLGMALVPVETEVKLGAQLAEEVQQQQRVLADEETQAYVAGIFAPLVEASRRDRADLQYQVRVLDDREQVNAFALPGGYIYVYTGLLLLADNEAEVAGVLAHEIGHVVARHSANRLATQMGVSVLASVALGEQPNVLAKLASDLAGASTMAAFSRDDEREADHYGLAYSMAAGYDPRGLETFFRKLLEQEGGHHRGTFEGLLASHPATGERIADLQKRILQAGDAGGRLEAERYGQARTHLWLYYQQNPAE
ncbi:MAG: M48 family metallopeptidase [Gemmatimonadota bacterium]